MMLQVTLGIKVASFNFIVFFSTVLCHLGNLHEGFGVVVEAIFELLFSNSKVNFVIIVGLGWVEVIFPR